MRLDPLQRREAGFGVPLACPRLSPDLGNGALHTLQIGDGKLGVDGFHVGDRVDRACDMDHVGILEAAHHLSDGVCLPDVVEKLVSQTFAARRPLDQAGDVNELDHRRYHPGGAHDPRDLVETLVGDVGDADVGFDRGERVVLGCDLPGGEGVEQGGLADVGESDDGAADAHGYLSQRFGRG